MKPQFFSYSLDPLPLYKVGSKPCSTFAKVGGKRVIVPQFLGIGDEADNDNIHMLAFLTHFSGFTILFL